MALQLSVMVNRVLYTVFPCYPDLPASGGTLWTEQDGLVADAALVNGKPVCTCRMFPVYRSLGQECAHVHALRSAGLLRESPPRCKCPLPGRPVVTTKRFRRIALKVIRLPKAATPKPPRASKPPKAPKERKTLPPGVPVCRHCQRRRAKRARGLCWRCSQDPAIRALYPSNSKHARLGIHARRGAAPLPASPTRAAPGSAAKLAVLEARAEAGLTLWHPEDPRIGRVTRWGVPTVRSTIPVPDK